MSAKLIISILILMMAANENRAGNTCDRFPNARDLSLSERTSFTATLSQFVGNRNGNIVYEEAITDDNGRYCFVFDVKTCGSNQVKHCAVAFNNASGQFKSKSVSCSSATARTS